MFIIAFNHVLGTSIDFEEEELCNNLLKNIQVKK